LGLVWRRNDKAPAGFPRRGRVSIDTERRLLEAQVDLIAQILA